MSKWRKFWTNKFAWYPSMILGPTLFNVGIKMAIMAGIGVFGVVMGFVVSALGLALIWIPFNAFKKEHGRLVWENNILSDELSTYRGRRQRNENSASDFAWVDDDDIDGDGVGGDSLRRMGITDRFQ